MKYTTLLTLCAALIFGGSTAPDSYGQNIVSDSYLKAPNTDAFDSFGVSVATSDNHIVVGAPSESSNQQGVDKDGKDNSSKSSGAVYVYERYRDSNGAWQCELRHYLKASNTDAGAYFGLSVAIDGDTIVVGSPFEQHSGTPYAGAAYVFRWNGEHGISSEITQEDYLTASSPGFFDRFGYSVAICENHIVVGSPGDDSNKTDSGAAYVFVRGGTDWSQQEKLKSAQPDTHDMFGTSVDISRSPTSEFAYNIVVGAFGEDGQDAGVGGNASSNSLSRSGAAYIFRGYLNSWDKGTYLKSQVPEVEGLFGYSVAVHGDTVVVGALQEMAATGNAYVYEYITSPEGSWSPYWKATEQIFAPNPNSEDHFGAGVDIYEVDAGGAAGVGFVDAIVVGAWEEDSNATGVHGDQSDNSATNAGAAYLFMRSGQHDFVNTAYLKASNTGAHDSFGYSVAICENHIVVGALSEDSNATGVNGDPLNNSSQSAGAAYTFRLAPIPAGTSYGSGCGNGGGDVPELSLFGYASPDYEIQAELWHGSGSLAVLFVGTQQTSLNIGFGCSLLVGPMPVVALGPFPLTNGVLTATGTLPPASSIYPLTLTFQGLVADSSAKAGFVASNGFEMTIFE